MNTLSDEHVTRLVAKANPVPEFDGADVVDAVWARLDGAFATEVVVPLRRRRRRIAITGAVIAAVAALTAAAPFIVTRTGIWNEPEWVSAGGPGEIYRLDGTDFAGELDALTADIPFPDEASRAVYLDWMAFDAANAGPNTAASTGALRAEAARGAVCAWIDAWQSATASGDEAAVQRSADAIAGSLRWPAVLDVDPQPAVNGDEVDDGSRGPTVFGYLPVFVDATAAGDPKALAEAADDSSYCGNAERPRVDSGARRPRERPASPAATAPGER